MSANIQELLNDQEKFTEYARKAFVIKFFNFRMPMMLTIQEKLILLNSKTSSINSMKISGLDSIPLAKKMFKLL